LFGELQRATMWLAQNAPANPDNAGAGAYAYMELMGLVALGWMWLKLAAVSADSDSEFHESKLITARFFAKRELVAAPMLRHKVEAGSESLMALPADAF
jgi:hypothetical protein